MRKWQNKESPDSDKNTCKFQGFPEILKAFWGQMCQAWIMSSKKVCTSILLYGTLYDVRSQWNHKEIKS